MDLVMTRDRMDSIQPKLLSEMSTEELLEYIREIRQQRKIPQRQLKAKAKKKSKKKDELAALLGNLSPEKLKEMLGE
jgi:hypothetical protein